MGSARIAAAGTAGNAEPQLGKGRGLWIKSDSPSWGLAFPETSSAHAPLASRRDSKIAAPYRAGFACASRHGALTS